VCIGVDHAHLTAQYIHQLRQIFNSRISEELTYAGVWSPERPAVFGVMHGDTKFEQFEMTTIASNALLPLKNRTRTLAFDRE
jgi:hypothetical protein